MLLEQGNVILKTFAVSPGMSLFLTLTIYLSMTVYRPSKRPIPADLNDVPPQDPDWELYTDKNSFIQDGKQMKSYAVTTMEKVIETKALPSNVSSQKAEQIPWMRALELSKGKKEKIWTNSEYAFITLYVSGVI